MVSSLVVFELEFMHTLFLVPAPTVEGERGDKLDRIDNIARLTPNQNIPPPNGQSICIFDKSELGLLANVTFNSSIRWTLSGYAKSCLTMTHPLAVDPSPMKLKCLLRGGFKCTCHPREDFLAPIFPW